MTDDLEPWDLEIFKAAPSVVVACADLRLHLGLVEQWARNVESGLAPAYADELETLRGLVRAVNRAAERVADVAAAERDQDRALPPGWKP